MTRLRIGTIMVALASVFEVHGLTWETTQISTEATPDQESFQAVYRFTNESGTTVTIESVRSSCGCTVPELAKHTYAPGESGEVTAVFDFGTRTGRQQKTITVLTDEAGAEHVELSLEVNIPTLIEVKPFFVFWRKDDPIETKFIELRVSDPGLIQPVAVETPSADFSAELEPTDDPAVFRVAVTPKSTGTSGNTYLLVSTNFPAASPRTVRVYAGIR